MFHLCVNPAAVDPQDWFGAHLLMDLRLNPLFPEHRGFCYRHLSPTTAVAAAHTSSLFRVDAH